MISIGQKESILRKEGAVIPSFPTRPFPDGLRQSKRDETSGRAQKIDREYNRDIRAWRATVEALYNSWLFAQR